MKIRRSSLFINAVMENGFCAVKLCGESRLVQTVPVCSRGIGMLAIAAGIAGRGVVYFFQTNAYVEENMDEAKHMR